MPVVFVEAFDRALADRFKQIGGAVWWTDVPMKLGKQISLAHLVPNTHKATLFFVIDTEV
jgi:hypothetical protein